MVLGADITASFRALVRAALSPEIDYLAHYKARVVSCAADGATVDVQAEDPRVARSVGQAVPLLVGLPSAVAVVSAGAEVWIGWDAGDPARPHALPVWSQGATITSLKIAGGTKGAVRVDDHLTASSQMAAWALVVETAINAVAPGTFNPANQFAGVTIGNPGKAAQFGTAADGSTIVKVG